MILATNFSKHRPHVGDVERRPFREDRNSLIAAAQLLLVDVDIALRKIALPKVSSLVKPHLMSTEEARVGL